MNGIITKAPLLEFVEVTYHDPRFADPLLLGLDLSICAGEGVVLTGPASCGKTTALGLVMGAGCERMGEILILGHHPASLRSRELTGLRTRIGYLAQHGALLSNLTLRDNIALPLLYHRNANAAMVDTELRAACDLVELDLDELPDVQPHLVTHELRQLVALAKAMILAPAILLLDEPTAHLSVKAAANFWKVLENVRAKHSIALLITAHDDTLVRTVCRQSIALPARGPDFLLRQRG